MAQRRMLSLDVIDSDAFLEMPVSSQLLYFHLNARADDDGFISSANKILRMIGCQSDDLRVLISKKFVIRFEDGVCVVKHWRINNFIRKDIYTETNYTKHKALLSIRANGAYTLTEDARSLKIPKGHFTLEHVNASLTERQLSIGKVSEGKIGDSNESQGELAANQKNVTGFNKYADDYIEGDIQIDPDHKPKAKKKEKKVSDDVQAVFDLFNNPASALWRLREVERVAAQALYDTYGIEKLTIRMKRIEEEKQKKDPYFPEVNTPSQLLDKMPNVERYLNI